MEDKLTYYDVVAHLVPGALVLGVLALVPRVLDFDVPWPASDFVSLAAAVPLAYATGQVVQALASMMQPLYYKLWGGMPSTRLLEGESNRLTDPRRTRITTTLSAHLDVPAASRQEREALFLDAVALCNREGASRVDSFNVSYAFHRALLTAGAISTLLLLVVLIASLAGWPAEAEGFRGSLVYFLVLGIVLTTIEFFRARQRGEYFALEVLNSAYMSAREHGASQNQSNVP